MGEPPTQEQIDAARERASAQFEETMQGDIPRVTCECGHCMPLRFAFKCLYCSCWFCLSCAEMHFGKTREQYNKAAVTSRDQSATVEQAQQDDE